MASVNDIVARLTLNAKNFTAGFDTAVNDATAKARSGGTQISRAFSETAGGGLRSFAGGVPALGGALTGLSGAALGAAAGIGALSAVVSNGLQGVEEYTQATRGLDAVLKATGNNTGYTADQLKAYADELEVSLAVTAETVLKTQQVLATFDGVAGTTFKRAITAAADLSAVYGGDLAGNAEKLGIVLQNLGQGNVDGLSKGFKFLGAATLDSIAALAKAGDTAAAQTRLLDALDATVGGSGVSVGQGLSGSFFRLKTALDDVSEAFVRQTGIYAGIVGGVDSITDAITRYSSELKNLNGLQLTGQAFTYFSAIANPGAALGRFIAGKVAGKDDTGPSAAGNAARDSILALDAQREKSLEDQAAKRAADRAKAEGDKARAAEAAAKAVTEHASAAKRAADDAERAAKALEKQRSDLAATVADYEFQAKLAGMTRDQAEKLTASRKLELQYGKLLTDNDRQRVARAIELRQINAEGRAQDDAALGVLRDSNNGFLDDLAKRGTSWIDAAADAQKDLVKKQEADFRYLSDSFYDVFSGRSGNIWNKFKELGARTLSELAAQFVLGGSINIGGTSGGGLINSIIGAVTGKGGSSLAGTALSGLGASAGVAGLIGSSGLAASAGISAAAASAAGVPALAGTAGFAAGGGASGASGLIAGLGAAAPWLAALAGLAALGAALIPGITPRSFQNLNTDSNGSLQASFGGARGKGKDALQSQAEEIAATFGTSLESVLATFGGKLQANATIGSIGPANGKFEFKTGNTTVDGYDRSGGTTQVFATAEEAASAALQSVFSRGLVTGIDASVQKLLSSGDFATQSAKAVLLSSALKEFNNAANPNAEAVKALTEQFTLLRDVMAEAGSSAADVAKASALYDTKLQQIRDSAGAATTTLQSFLDSLGFGSSSPLALGDQLVAAQANYNAKAGGIGSAGFDQQAFVAAGQTLLDITGQVNGRTQDFFSVFNQVQADTNRAITGINNASSITGDNPFARKTADNTGATADNTALIAQQLDGLPASISAAIAAALNDRGFIGGNARGFAA